MEDENVLIEKYKFLKSRLRKYPFVRFKKHPPKNSILEAIFSRGDRQLSCVLLSAWKKGARFDSWTDRFKFRAWEEAFISENIDYGLYLKPLEKKETLPWEHIDTGIKKSHLLKEWDKAIKEERTLSCRDSKCGLCEGCVYSASLERKFPEKIKISSGKFTFFGKITPEELRYRAFYSKLNAARFISQIDLNNIIQRSFRRAGISVIHSGGFHPKMLISYPPALPLGMEGKAECLDFRSRYHFDKKKFVSRMNKYLPSGIKFLSLRSLENSESSLSKGIKTLAYSIDLKSQEVSEALEAIRKENSASSSDHFEIIEKLVDDFLAKNENECIEDISLDRKTDKLFISIKYSPQKSIRTQKIAEDIFQMKNPVFAMAREKILFENRIT
jgi:radical SAM-linked protein